MQMAQDGTPMRIQTGPTSCISCRTRLQHVAPMGPRHDGDLNVLKELWQWNEMFHMDGTRVKCSVVLLRGGSWIPEKLTGLNEHVWAQRKICVTGVTSDMLDFGGDKTARREKHGYTMIHYQ